MESPHDIGDFKKYKDKTDYLIALQSFLLAVINQFAVICLKKRSVKSTVTLPFLCVSQITFESNDSVLFWQFIEERITSLQKQEIKNGIKAITATSRVKKNRIIHSNQLLEDFLFELGYRFEYQFLFRKDGSVSLELVSKIRTLNHEYFTKRDIKMKGIKINNYLSGKLESHTTCIIERNNESLRNFLSN